MTLDIERIRADFDPGAGIGREFPGYIYRDEQVKLACEIADIMDRGSVLLAEAETGTGKTMAYLVPALHSRDRVLVSTHTRALQDQLVHRDLPAVQKALGLKRKIALLKGRSNYLCPHRMEKSLTSGKVELWAQKWLLKVRDWAEQTPDGDLAGLPFDVFEKGIGPQVTATAEQCGGAKCPEYERCPLMKARKKAQEADIVVTNHSLLLADAALKSGDFGEVLPHFDVYILDEAHAIPDVASQHFGVQLTRLRIIQWFNDLQAVLDELGDETALKAQLADALKRLLEAWPESTLAELLPIWQELQQAAESRAERSEEMTKVADRAVQIGRDFGLLIKPAAGFVGWSEGEGENLRYLLAPVETGPVLAEHLWQRPAAFVLLSATLRVSERFDYAKTRLGLPDAAEAFHPSPFDYGRQALIYLPKHIPDYRSDPELRKLTDEIESLLRASQGRAFVLFTSWQSLNRVGPALEGRLPWNVLIQGKSGSRDAILETFREDTHSVLCGTRSFWEGVDVPGEALSMVIIDRMPFAPPSDPLLQARLKRCEEQGGNGFRDIQLAEAIAVLRQGAGRLIRSVSDYGVMAILDSRLYRMSYGREVARNLPPAPIVADIDEVRSFYRRAL